MSDLMLKRARPWAGIPAIAALLVCAAFFQVMGQTEGSPEGRMFINKSTLRPNETLNITIVVKGYDLPVIEAPDWPDIPELTLVDRTQSVIPTVVSGRTYTRCRFVASYIPQDSGIFTIPAIRIDIPGFTFQTQPVEIKVLNPDGSENPTVHEATPTPAARAPRPSPPQIEEEEEVRIITDLSTTRPYVGEQVVLTYKILTNISIGQKVVQEQRPEYKQFWVEQAPSEPQPPFETFVQRGTRYYQTQLERLVLFPLESGEITLEPASWRIIAKFERPSYHEEERVIRTDRVTLRAQPLPAGDRTPGERVQVGRYRLNLHYDSNALKLGQAFPLYLTIRGSGNIRGLLPPEIPEEPTFELVSTRAVHDEFLPVLDNNQNPPVLNFGGEKVWEILIYPKQLGELIFPPIDFTFFDPRVADYRTTRTEAIRFTVAEVGDERDTLMEPAAEAKTEFTPLSTLTIVLVGLAAVLLLAGLFWILFRRRTRMRVAGRKISSIDDLLAEAEDIVGHKGSSAFYDLLFNSVVLILQRLAGVPVQALTREELVDVIRRQHLSMADIQKIIGVLEFCDEARFAALEVDRKTREDMLERVKRLHQQTRSAPPPQER
ncbi:MAG: BatD family protein [Acidobacteria bacterium]|nr:BatD family protein [Acidobacteriota bacterium]